MNTTNNIFIAFIMTSIAGFSTVIGSIIVFINRDKSYKSLSLFLGLSAGVMIYVSFMEILPESVVNLQFVFGNKLGMQYATFSFFLGICICAGIDRLVPTGETKTLKKNSIYKDKKQKLIRTGTFTALTIAIHNFPEGIASFMSSVNDPTMALPIVFAIALHNIPEGMAVSAPIYYATRDKIKTLRISFYTGLAEPLGAITAYLILYKYMNDIVFGVIFGIIAGIMIFISFDELLPSAEEYGQHHISIIGLIIGMAIMAISLIMFE